MSAALRTAQHTMHVAFCDLAFTVTRDDTGSVTSVTAADLPTTYAKAMEAINAGLHRGVSLSDQSLRLRAIQDLIAGLLNVERGLV